MSKSQVIAKRNLTDHQYRKFASSVGKRIDFNRKMTVLASHFETTIYHLSKVVDDSWSEDDSPIHWIYDYHSKMNQEDSSIPGIISSDISATPLVSFRRHGDINCLTAAIRKHYIDEEGLHLDQQSEIISDTHAKTISENDLIEFIIDHPSGADSYRSALEVKCDELSEKFKATVGFALNSHFVGTFCSTFRSVEKTLDDVPF